MNKTIRILSLLLLLLVVILQITSVILLEFNFKAFEIEEVHEILGFTIIGLIIVHIVIFRKSLKNLLFKKSN